MAYKIKYDSGKFYDDGWKYDQLEESKDGKVRVWYRNILETSNVTVTSENSSYPKYRLHDRHIGKLFKGGSTPSYFYITSNQGASPYDVDALIIPAGHNLSGLVLSIQYSTDNFVSDTKTIMSWAQSGSGQIFKWFPVKNKQYWRLKIANPASAPELAEMFLGLTLEFERNVSYGLIEGDEKNEEIIDSRSGMGYGIKYGDPKKYCSYSLTKIAATQKEDFQDWDRHSGSVKGIYIANVGGELFFAYLLTKKLVFRMEHEGRYGCDLELLEVLGATT